MRARMQSLDMLANNIANSSSVGYKADSEFYSLYHDESAGLDPANPAPAESPVIEKAWTDFSQGQLNQTGNELDLSLAGDGFFEMQTKGGPAYTRDGSFHLSADGVLQNRQGYPVLNTEGKPITLDVSQPVEVDSDGRIHQQNNEIAQLKLVKFSTPQALTKQEHANFRLAISDLKPSRATGVEVHQRSLEAANVQPAQAAVRLVSVMRQFEMLQKAMTIGNDMNKRAIEDVARASG